MALIRPIPSNVNVTKLSEVAFTRDTSDTKYCRADITSLYPDYQNITIDNIICQLKATSVGNITTGGTEVSYSYDSSTGVISAYATYGIWATGSNTKFDVFIVR